MYDFAKDSATVNLNDLRARLRKMSDDELRKFGKAAAYMCSERAARSRTPRPEFVIQLEEARAEWKRRSDLKRKGHLK